MTELVTKVMIFLKVVKFVKRRNIIPPKLLVFRNLTIYCATIGSYKSTPLNTYFVQTLMGLFSTNTFGLCRPFPTYIMPT